MNRKKIYYAIVALQVLALAGMIGFKYSTVLTGKTVVLRVNSHYPRHHVRGERVRINFEIDFLETKGLGGDEGPFKKGDDLYVVLVEDNTHWKANSIFKEKPEIGIDEAVIKGKILSVNPSYLKVDYGVDSFYVPEGKGRKLMYKQFWEVALDRSGHALIKGPVDR